MKKIISIICLTAISSIILIFSCGRNDADDIPNGTEQQAVFKEFWDIFDKHYPLFHRKNIDWQTVYNTYSSQIKASTTDNQLFEIFNSIMKEVIKDGHTEVTYNDEKVAGYTPPFNEDIFMMVENNTPNKVNITQSSANNPYLSYGTLVNYPNIGYINSKSFEPVNENDSEFDKFKEIVDEALIALKDKTGIILDIRTNGGGQPHYAFYLAGRFFTTSTPKELIRQRIKTTTGSGIEALGNWATEPFEGYPDSRAEGGYIAGIFPEFNSINKSGDFQFTKKVALLTSMGTASAGEYITIALKTQPQIKTFGDKTFGIFSGSDILTLKNGKGKWKTRISTHDVEVMFNGTFQSFEGIGIPPDEKRIPTAIQLSNGEDIHIDAAISYINQ